MNYTNTATTLLSYLLPITDPNVRFQIAMTIGQPIGMILEYLNKYVINANIWRGFYRQNFVTIHADHPKFGNLMNYYYDQFAESIKGVNLINNGKYKIMIELLKTRSIHDNDIEIKLQKETWDIVNPTEHQVSDQILIFMSYKSVKEINLYINKVIEKSSLGEDSTMEIFNVDIYKTEKTRRVEWKSNLVMSNRSTSNTIVSDKVNKAYFEDIETFCGAAKEYRRKGIGYSRGYCLHGNPGSGKSALWESVANDNGWSVFKIDMSVVSNNSEVYLLINTIYDWIAPNTKHILLLEDFDRCELFKRWNNSRITIDCILDVLDARGANGRITIITANDMYKFRDHDAYSALFRPGRIDVSIEINKCTITQIQRILNLYFDTEDQYDLSEDIQITVAELNKIIILQKTVDLCVEFLNKFLKFEGGDFIEELCRQFNDDNGVEIDVEEVSKKVKTTRKNKNNKKKPGPTKIYGGGAIEKLEKNNQIW